MRVHFPLPELSKANEFYLALQRYLAHLARKVNFPACGVPMTHGELSKLVQLYRKSIIVQMVEERALKA
jgi:hypothetical protein